MRQSIITAMNFCMFDRLRVRRTQQSSRFFSGRDQRRCWARTTQRRYLTSGIWRQSTRCVAIATSQTAQYRRCWRHVRREASLFDNWKSRLRVLSRKLETHCVGSLPTYYAADFRLFELKIGTRHQMAHAIWWRYWKLAHLLYMPQETCILILAFYAFWS